MSRKLFDLGTVGDELVTKALALRTLEKKVPYWVAKSHPDSSEEIYLYLSSDSACYAYGEAVKAFDKHLSRTDIVPVKSHEYVRRRSLLVTQLDLFKEEHKNLLLAGIALSRAYDRLMDELFEDHRPLPKIEVRQDSERRYGDGYLIASNFKRRLNAVLKELTRQAGPLSAQRLQDANIRLLPPPKHQDNSL